MATLPHQEGDFRPSVVPSKMTSPLFPSAEVFWKFTSMKVAQSLLAPTRHRSLLRRLRTAAPLPDTPCDEAADDVSQTEEKQKSPLDLPSPHRKKEAESAGQTLRESNPQFPRDKVSGLNIGGDDPVLKTPAVPLCKSQTEGIAGSLGKEETTVECAGLKADEELCRGQESKPGEEEKEGRIEEEDHVKQLVAEVRLGNVIFTGVVTSRETGINVINDKGEARFLAPGPPGEQARETVLLQYKGDFRSSTLEGEGQFTWQDGSVYNGQVLRGKRHGFGILTSPDGEKEYRGMWKDGQRNGQGTLRYDREGICEYTGMWVNNLRQGWGRQRYRRGVYEGQWKAGVRHGVGRMEWTDLHIQYAGQWRDGVPDGWGVQSWTQENSAERCAESDEDVADGQLRLNRYEGWFKNGVREGFGIFWYASGSRYEGYWRSSKKHGRAQYVNEAGCVHEAVFENDRVVCVSERFTDLESGLHSKSPLSLSSVNVSKKPFFPLPSSFGTSCTSLSPTPKATPVQRNLFFSTMVASSSASMLVSLDDIFLLEMLRTPPPQRLLATGNSRNTMGKPSRNPVAAQESSGAPGDARRRRDGGDKRRTTCDTEFKVLNPLSPQEATDRALCGTYKWILRNLKTLRRTYALYRRIACFPGQDPLSMSFLQFWILAADARLLTADRPLSRILRALEVATQFAPTPSECLNFAKTKSPSVALDSSSRSEPLGDGPVTHTPSTDTSKNCFSLEPTNDAFRSLGTGGPHESVCSGDSRCPLENGRGFPPLAGCTVASGASGYDGNASAGTSGNLHLSSAISDTAFNTSQPAMSSLSSRDRSTLAQPPRGTPNHCDVVEQRPLLLSSFLRALVLLAQDQLLHEEAVNANAATLVTSPWCPAPRKSVDVALSSFTVSLLQFYETCSSNVGGGSRKESLSNPTMKRNSSMCSRSGRKRSSSLASRRSSLSRKMASPQTFKSPSLDAFKPFTDPEILQAFAPLRPFFARRFAFVPPDAGPSFKCELEKASKTKKQPPGESEYVEASRHPVSSALTNDTVDTFPAATMSRGPRMTGSVYLQEFLLMLRRWGLLISSAETEAAKQILPAEPSAPTTEEEQPSPSTEHSTLQPADSEKTAGASGGPFQPSRAQRTSPLSEAPGVVGRCEKSRRRLSVTAGSPDAKTKGQNARLAPAGAESEPAAPPEETEGPADSRSPGTPGTEAKDKCAEEKRQTPIPLRSLLCDAFKGASLAVTPVEVLYFLFHFLPEFHDQENALATFQELREEKRKKRLERAATNLPSNEILSPSLSVAPPPSSGSSPPRGNPGFEECPVPSRAEAFPAPGALGPNANSVASDAKRNGRNTKLRSPINSRPAAGRRGPGPDTSSPSSPSQSSKRGEKDEGKLRSENSRRRSGPRVTITNVPQVIVEESAPDLSTGTPRVDLNDRLDRLDGSAKAYATTGMARDDTNDDGEEQGNKHTGPQPTLRDGDNTSIRGKEENNHGMSYCRGKETTLKHHGAGGTLCWPRPFATRAIEKSYRKLLRKILGKRSASWTELVYREVTVIEVMMVLLKIVEFKTPPCLAAQLSLPFRLSILVGAIAQHELTQETCVSTSTKTQRCWPVLSLRDHPQVALLTLVSSQDPSELPMHFPPVISAPPEQLSRTTVERDSEKAPLSPSSHVVRSPALGATAARGPQQSSHTSGPAPPEALLFSAPAQSPTSPDKPGVSASGAAEGKKDFSNAFFWESFDSVPSLPRICEGKECGSFTVLDAPLLWATSDEDDAQEGNDSDRENEPSDTE